jgi:hypothetical protein
MLKAYFLKAFKYWCHVTFTKNLLTGNIAEPRIYVI